jgi:hypothetical protein
MFMDSIQRIDKVLIISLMGTLAQFWPPKCLREGPFRNQHPFSSILNPVFGSKAAQNWHSKYTLQYTHHLTAGGAGDPHGMFFDIIES